MARADTYTRWGIVASGEGGNRVAAELLSREENPGIDERITLLNTNRADVRNTIDSMEIATETDDHTLIFGDKRGVGNDFIEGERQARAAIDRIAGQMDDNMLNADALMYITTLGGGTGNGSVPYIIRQFGAASEDVEPGDFGPWATDGKHLSLAVWPYYYEPAQRQFNAMCGLSRLLMVQNQRQNADMTLLVSNSHLDNVDDDADSYEAVNRRIVEAMDLMIGAGRETQGVIDVEDYVAQPSNMNVYHFTPAVATGMDGTVLEWEFMFDKAADNAYVPMDPSTAEAAFAVVRAPKRAVDRGEVSETEIVRAFNDWKRDNDIGGVGYTTLIPTDRRGNDVDVLLLLGGFDLNPLLNHARDGFEQHKQGLERSRQLGGGNTADLELIEDLKRNLDAYVELHTG